MPLDPNGIWQYEETDAEATASDLLNLLAASVSARVADLQVNVDSKQPAEPDSGWVGVGFGSSYSDASSAYPVQVRKRGPEVRMRGSVRRSANFAPSTAYPNAIIIPAGFRPANLSWMAIATGTGQGNASLLISASDGTVELRTGPGTFTSTLGLDGLSWTVD